MKVTSGNENKIVRVRNKKMDRAISYVMKLTKTNYQYVFETMCDYITDGHMFGEYTETKLVEMVLLRKAMDDDD